MKLVHIIGRKNNGKTTLIVELIQELKRRGVNVGSLKHSGHEHELDTPGKDSYRHHAAGGDPAVVMTQNQVAIYLSRDPGDDFLEKLAPLYSSTDVVLVEGYINGPGKKIEVWRQEVGTDPLVNERNDIVAVVTNDKLEVELPTLPRDDMNGLADFIVDLIEV